jgi:hypothetical protein
MERSLNQHEESELSSLNSNRSCLKVIDTFHLNTHGPVALYETFEPAEAKRILDRLEFHYTPKHGSWLNMVEIEIGVLGTQCLDDRIPDMETLRRECAAWETERNVQKASVDWRFTTIDARNKLKRLYPHISKSP